MKQGTGKSSMAGGKVEPQSQAVSVDKVAGIGIQQIRTQPQELYKGRGYQAPMASSTSHPAGSQGKHK